MQSGRLVTNGVVLEPHENSTVYFLIELGYDIELIPESHTPKVKSPDFYMGGIAWETKSPVVNKIKAIEHLFYRSVRQSDSVVFDLRRLKGSDEPAKKMLEKCYKSTRRLKNMYIITKNGNLQRYHK